MIFLPIVRIYEDVYFLWAYIISSLTLVFLTKIKFNTILLISYISYLMHFFIPLYYYALFEKLDIWFEYLGLDLLNSEYILKVMFIVNFGLIIIAFISKLYAPYENKLLIKIKDQIKKVDSNNIEKILKITIILAIIGCCFTIFKHFELGIEFYDHSNKDRFERFLMLVLNPFQLEIIVFIIFFISLVNNYNLNKGLLIFVILVSITGLIIGSRSSLVGILIITIIVFFLASKINHLLSIFFMKNKYKILLYAILISIVLIIFFHIGTILRYYLYSNHGSTFIELISNVNFISIKRIIARLSYIDVVSLQYVANTTGYDLLNVNILKEYFNFNYEIKYFINSLVPGDIFKDSTINLGEIFRVVYLGFTIEEIIKSHQSYVPTIYGYLFSMIYPSYKLSEYFLIYIFIVSMVVFLSIGLIKIGIKAQCHYSIKILLLFVVFILFKHLYQLQSLGWLFSIVYQKSLISLAVIAIIYLGKYIIYDKYQNR